MSEATAEYQGALDRGLEGVVACSTAISTIAGTTLLYRGYTIEDLAANATFEEVVVPALVRAAAQRRRARRASSASCATPWRCRRSRSAGSTGCRPTSTRWTSCTPWWPASRCTTPTPTCSTYEANLRKAVRLTARLAHDRRGLRPRAERPVAAAAAAGALAGLELPLHAARHASRRRSGSAQFDTCLILHADHELNASAFSARVTSSTLSGMYSSIMAAIGTLKGPLHGGANEQVMRMLLEIGTPKRLEAYLDDALAGEAQGDGLRPPRLQGGRPARGDPEAHERASSPPRPAGPSCTR